MKSIAWCPKWGQVVVVCAEMQCVVGGRCVMSDDLVKEPPEEGKVPPSLRG